MTFRVHPLDLDVLRHMNNGTYLTLGDLGRVDLMNRSGVLRETKRRGWYPVVASQTITYRRALKLGQQFTLHTRMLGFDGHSVFIEHRFTVDDQLYARAIIRGRFLKSGGGAVTGEELQSAVEPAPEGTVVPDWVRTWADDARVNGT